MINYIGIVQQPLFEDREFSLRHHPVVFLVALGGLLLLLVETSNQQEQRIQSYQPCSQHMNASIRLKWRDLSIAFQVHLMIQSDQHFLQWWWYVFSIVLHQVRSSAMDFFTSSTLLETSSVYFEKTSSNFTSLSCKSSTVLNNVFNLQSSTHYCFIVTVLSIFRFSSSSSIEYGANSIFISSSSVS